MKIQDLRLALTATPKKTDIRYYLNGLKITKDTVSASNGHILCHINTYQNELPEQLDNNDIPIPDNFLIVPVDTIKALLKKIGTKHENKEVGIFLINNRYELTCMNQTEIFTPIDGKYPSFDKILTPVKANNHDENLNKILHQFDWSYVALANDAICKYYGNTTPKRLYSCNECGYFMPSLDNDIIYVIMPCRN
jgi:DNA polymerase III sliding clamp (beta) subunit (PCNA family)